MRMVFYEKDRYIKKNCTYFSQRYDDRMLHSVFGFRSFRKRKDDL